MVQSNLRQNDKRIGILIKKTFKLKRSKEIEKVKICKNKKFKK